MAYFVTVVVVAVLGVTWWLVTEARRETRLVPRPHERRTARRTARRSRLMETGDRCSCGGVLGPSGRESERFGPLLGCTGCTRTWTLTGQRVRRRTVPAQAAPPPTAPPQT
jgi:hypothetical protein